VVKINGLSFWPFKGHHQAFSDSETEHRVDLSFDDDGVFYHATPELNDWPNQWTNFNQDRPILSLLNQLEDLGYINALDNRLFLAWEALYQLLASDNGNSAELLALLKLPQLCDYRPSLLSQGSLEDLDFRITLGEWTDNNDLKLLSAPIVEGAVIRTLSQSFLLEEAVWRLVREIRTFYALAKDQRSPQQNRQYWSQIRRHACVANVPMEDFLQRTVVLSPEKLMLHLHQSVDHGKKTVQVEPDFEGAPSQWVTTFDKFSAIPERYDIPDGQGIVQILVSPQVRSVLQEIRRWPGRYVSGQRAEAFIRNPYAALGDDAIAVIDENQFEEAREAAGIDFERFFVDVEYLDSGIVKGVALIIESTSEQNKRSSRFQFENAEQLGEFIALFEKQIKDGRQCLFWKGYELEILGEAESELENLKHIFNAWMPKLESKLAYADIFDLGRYSERIEGIGVDKKYVSAYIARKSDEDGWVPDNIEFGFSITDPKSEAIENIPLDQQDRETIQAAINEAKNHGLDEVVIPGIKKPISINDAQDMLKTIDNAEQDVNNGEFHATKIKPSGQTLLLKSNIDHVDYLEDRQRTLELPSDRQPRLPNALRPSIKLKQHQLQGVAWLQNLWDYAPDYCRGALLADDMGLGKTLQILTFMARCIEENPNIEPMLVVAPVSLLENWQEEIEKFFEPESFPIMMLYGANLREKKLHKSEIDPQLVNEGLVKFLVPNWVGNSKIVLTTYETLRDLEFSLAAQPWSIMVCDEAQKIKNPNALVTRSAKKQNVRFKIACTGTPVENSLADLWCLFDFIQPGLLGALNAFGSRYRRPIEAKTEEEKSRVNELRVLIEPQTLRRTKAQVAKDLPSKIEDNSCRSLPISSFQRQLYVKAIQSYRAKQSQGSSGSNHLGLIQYLRQLCSSPYPPGRKVDLYESVAEHEVKSPKLKWLLESLKEIQQRKEKVIVFVEFLDLQRQLQAYIAQRFSVLPDIINGTTSAAASAVNSRQKRIRAFQEKPGFGVIILSPLAVGFGVNIQAANHVIHYTRTWNPAKEDQATDRAYRIGQTKDVTVYYPVITAEFVTFDMKLDKLLGWKRALSDDMLNGCGDLSGSEFEEIVMQDVID
jgi:hypothetical protein